MKVLQARSKPATVMAGDKGKPSDDGGRGAGHDDQRQTAPARAYLDQAATAIEGEPDFELEIVDRARATADQWRVIASYLHRPRASQVEALKDEQGPVVVDWDDGEVVQTEQETQTLVDRLAREQAKRNGRAGGRTGCVVS